MINDIILLKQGEIVLKGLNRRSFEQKLMSNIKRRLDAIGNFTFFERYSQYGQRNHTDWFLADANFLDT